MPYVLGKLAESGREIDDIAVVEVLASERRYLAAIGAIGPEVPAPGGDAALADPANPTTLPPQTVPTIGDLLSAKGVNWAWYAGAWRAALTGQNAFGG